MNLVKIIGLAAAAAGIAGIGYLAAQNPGNVADTSADAPDEKLRTRHYKIDLPAFAAETEKIVPALTTYGQKWKIISSEVTEKSAVLQAEVPVVFFTDDLEIKANTFEKSGELTVNVHSASRVGNGDLGENRRHILQILEALDAKFGQK